MDSIQPLSTAAASPVTSSGLNDVYIAHIVGIRCVVVAVRTLALITVVQCKNRNIIQPGVTVSRLR